MKCRERRPLWSFRCWSTGSAEEGIEIANWLESQGLFTLRAFCREDLGAEKYLEASGSSLSSTAMLRPGHFIVEIKAGRFKFVSPEDFHAEFELVDEVDVAAG
jgi:hypothetical protein